MAAVTFEQWVNSLAERGGIDTLRNATVGFDAADFIDRLESYSVPIPQPIKEALVPALGGLPFGLKKPLRIALKAFADAGITPFFVFDGLDLDSFETRENLFAQTSLAATQREEAWEFYYNPVKIDGSALVNAFKSSKSISPRYLFRYFQTILRDHQISFMVAPYSAGAQLAYLYKVKSIDAISSTPDTLLYDVPEVITQWNIGASEFTWIKRQQCLNDLGVTSDMFVDAVLLSGGSPLIPMFPPLLATRKPNKVQAAVEMIVNMGKTGHAVVLQYEEDAQCRQIKYLDRFRKARLSVKHHSVLTDDGTVVPFEIEAAPSDLHFVLSVKLLDEMYYYLSKGIIGPRLINWLTFCEISYSEPFDNGENPDYRNLVKQKLLPARTDALVVLSKAMHIWYRKQKIKSRYWFEDPSNQAVLQLDSVENRDAILSKWNAHEDSYGMEKNKYWGKSGTIGIAVKVLDNKQVAKDTITPKDRFNHLNKKEEILLNSVWRTLHIRGYINDDHTLTRWGKALNATLSALPTYTKEFVGTLVEVEEASVIAMELAQLGLLNSNNMFPAYTPAQYNGDANDKRNALLVSRVASLGKFSHDELGYTGPLSRHILAYSSMINAVRESLRDLAEACLVQLLFNGDAVRETVDYNDLGYDLPFLHPNGCGLGIVVNTYLMELIGSESNTINPASKAQAKDSARKMFSFATDFAGDLEKAFNLWDAVYAGIKEAGNLIGSDDRQVFDEANKWLADLR